MHDLVISLNKKAPCSSPRVLGFATCRSVWTYDIAKVPLKHNENFYNHLPSVLRHCWLGHWHAKPVPDMTWTYNVFGGTLNLTQSINLRDVRSHAYYWINTPTDNDSQPKIKNIDTGKCEKTMAGLEVSGKARSARAMIGWRLESDVVASSSEWGSGPRKS